MLMSKRVLILIVVALRRVGRGRRGTAEIFIFEFKYSQLLFISCFSYKQRFTMTHINSDLNGCIEN